MANFDESANMEMWVMNINSDLNIKSSDSIVKMVIKASKNGDLAPHTVNHISNSNADLNNESRLQARHINKPWNLRYILCIMYIYLSLYNVQRSDRLTSTNSRSSDMFIFSSPTSGIGSRTLTGKGIIHISCWDVQWFLWPPERWRIGVQDVMGHDISI